MDGSQGILWTEDENGVRVYFGPRWTGERLIQRNPAPDASPVIASTVWSSADRVPNGLDRAIEKMRAAADAYVWTPNGMRPR